MSAPLLQVRNLTKHYGKREILKDINLRVDRGQVVVVNLWAMWCAPCKTEMPTLAALARAYQGRDLTVLPINVDATPEAVQAAGVGELLARIRLRLVDDSAVASENLLSAGDLRLDLKSRRARVGAETFDLTAREFALLEVFLRHPDQVLSREQILGHVWGYDFDPASNVVDVYVRALRNKIGSHRLETVRGMGYRLRASN